MDGRLQNYFFRHRHDFVVAVVVEQIQFWFFPYAVAAVVAAADVVVELEHRAAVFAVALPASVVAAPGRHVVAFVAPFEHVVDRPADCVAVEPEHLFVHVVAVELPEFADCVVLFAVPFGHYDPAVVADLAAPFVVEPEHHAVAFADLPAVNVAVFVAPFEQNDQFGYVGYSDQFVYADRYHGLILLCFFGLHRH